MLGVTCQFPEQAYALPSTALGFKQDSWVLSGDSVYHNGSKVIISHRFQIFDEIL